ncbi:major tail protein [Lacticaseibacillus paracasei]|uniref:Phage tail protein n=1 Tax=Lacticaseibacillus paracasei TaxID=1597 RepID=A0ABD7BQK9_LACPA|nr:major tail protein [Lacticaseibacillus paracasei]QOP54940.1 phage tail protein [Lacticaseibacillus paracasei]QPB56505.1 phage tail protein [Lacticaseibacillus paracasei]WPQ31565.1 major tail protein [Lacticaseibacillus paracasei]
MPKESKVQFGLKNAHYAIFNDDGTTVTYTKPVALLGSVELSLDPEGSTEPFYADDVNFYNAVSNQGYKGKLKIARVSDQFRQDVLQDILDDKGVLVENSQAQPKQIALMFEFAGDLKATRQVLYNVTVSRPSESGNTKEDKIKPDTAELEFSAADHPYLHTPKAKTTQTSDPTVYDKWYDEVYITSGKPATTPVPDGEGDGK